MSTQKALRLQSKQGPFVLENINLPEPNPGEVLVEIAAVALNPVDWKIATRGIIVDAYPAVLGTDIAGTVVALGPGTRGIAVGERVAFQGALRNAYTGFQQYTLADAELVTKLPSNVSFDAAASLSVGLATAALGLYSEPFSRGGAGLVPPWTGGHNKYAGQPIVVFGGSSSVGQYVLQLARLSGFSPIITTASPHNAALLQSLGATHVLDRRLSEDSLLSEIAKITPLPILHVYDAVSFPDTQLAAYHALSPGGILVIVLYNAIPKDELRENKKVVHVFGAIHSPLYRSWAVEFAKASQGLLEEKAIIPNPVEILPEGLSGIVGGLDRLRMNEVSGYKLVVRPQETP